MNGSASGTPTTTSVGRSAASPAPEGLASPSPPDLFGRGSPSSSRGANLDEQPPKKKSDTEPRDSRRHHTLERKPDAHPDDRRTRNDQEEGRAALPLTRGSFCHE